MSTTYAVGRHRIDLVFVGQYQSTAGEHVHTTTQLVFRSHRSSVLPSSLRSVLSVLLYVPFLPVDLHLYTAMSHIGGIPFPRCVCLVVTIDFTDYGDTGAVSVPPGTRVDTPQTELVTEAPPSPICKSFSSIAGYATLWGVLFGKERFDEECRDDDEDTSAFTVHWNDESSSDESSSDDVLPPDQPPLDPPLYLQLDNAAGQHKASRIGYHLMTAINECWPLGHTHQSVDSVRFTRRFPDSDDDLMRAIGHTYEQGEECHEDCDSDMPYLVSASDSDSSSDESD
jgi:hypothetical protein